MREVQSDPTSSPSVNARCARLLADTAALYEDIETTVRYQVMAINRSQDYVKASSNVPLTPFLTTVHLPDVLRTVRKCIDHEQTGRVVNIHPPEGMCEYITTDNLYISENLLCLLNNAVKYTDEGGVIDARLKIINQDGSSSLSSLPMVLVTVADTGVGVSGDMKAGLFQPFQVGLYRHI
jgi:signal transduction histidine kinase